MDDWTDPTTMPPPDGGGATTTDPGLSIPAAAAPMLQQGINWVFPQPAQPAQPAAQTAASSWLPLLAAFGAGWLVGRNWG